MTPTLAWEKSGLKEDLLARGRGGGEREREREEKQRYGEESDRTLSGEVREK
jgi:hypothetical protein